MTVIGLSGVAQSGKDTVGAHLVENHGFTRLAFADALRALALEVDPVLHEARNALRDGTPVRLSELVEMYGWDRAKKNDEVRRLLQALGVGVRRVLGEDTWLDVVARRIRTDPGNYVITDCRFPNEAEMVCDFGGQVWRIERPGFGPVNGHESETALEEWPVDCIIDNHGTLAELLAGADYYTLAVVARKAG